MGKKKAVSLGGVPKGTYGIVDVLRAAVNGAPSVKDLAEKAGVDRTTLLRFVNDPERDMNLTTASRVAVTLGFGLTKMSPSSDQSGLGIAPNADVLCRHVDQEVLPLRFLSRMPVAVYCADLSTGMFQLVNRPFARLLGFENSEDLLDAIPNAESLYRDLDSRQAWVTFLKEMEEPDSYNPCLQNLYVQRTRRRISIFDMARRIEFADQLYAFGFAVDVTDLQLKSELQAEQLRSFWALLNDRHINLGVHMVALDEDNAVHVRGINYRGRSMLGLKDDWCEQVRDIADLTGDPEANLRTVEKLSGSSELTVDGFRTFRTFTKSDSVPGDTPKRAREGATLPVVITDYGVPDPESSFEGNAHPSPRRQVLITSVRDVSIPPDVVDIIQKWGPTNPILDAARVQAFVKRCTNPGSDQPVFEFSFGNLTLKQRLILRRKLRDNIRSDSEPGVVYDDDGIETVRGKKERELFGEFGHQYQDTDRTVYMTGKELQQIEGHPAIDAANPFAKLPSAQVHVIKLPHLNATGTRVGVEGYFWDVRDEESVFEKLRAAYQPWSFLDALPVPVYRKDAQLRFIYVNSAYLHDIARVSTKRTIASAKDVIGLTDKELFEGKRAKQYEDDDRRLKQCPDEPIQRIERHGDYWVKVIKTAILQPSIDEFSRPNRTIGAIQGVFWRLDLDELQQFVKSAAATEPD